MKFGKYINLRIFAKINTHSSQKLQTHTLLNTKMKSFNQFLIVSYEYFSSNVNMHVQHDVFIHIYRHCVKLKKMDGIKRDSHLSNVPNEKKYQTRMKCASSVAAVEYIWNSMVWYGQK